MKKWIIPIIIIVACIAVLMVHSSDSSSPYLSISYTTYNNGQGPEGGMTTNILAYDIKTETLEKIGGFDYTSQYPLGAYSREDNKIYYSAENEKTKGDDLFALDLKTKKVEQLTDDLFAINRIIPRKDDILIVAVKRKTHALRVITYNKKTKKVEYENLQDDDTDTWSIGININHNNEFYTSTYSSEEAYRNSDMESTFEADRYYYPSETIYKYTDDFQNKKKILFFQNQKIDAISATDKYLLLDVLEYLSPSKGRLVRIDLATQKEERVKIPNYAVGHAVLSPDNKSMFFTGYPSNGGRGVYQYDFKTKQVKEIFVQEPGVGYINNFILLDG